MRVPKRPRYHHGDLRRVVLDASLALIAEEGVAALSLREVARRAGVTHGAPYHHFADRGAILAAIAEEGFALLRGEMLAQIEAAGPLARDRFEACGRGYFGFAVAHPAHFRVMFRPELSDPASHPAVDRAASAALQVLVDVVADGKARGAAPLVDPLALVVTGWSSAHGLAALWIDGPLSRGMSGLPANPLEMAIMVSRTLGVLFAAARRTEAAQT